MKCFLTGGTGYIGHQLAMHLAESGIDVHLLTRNLQSCMLPMHKNITAFMGDITDKSTIIPAMKSCDTVFHVAALVKTWARDKKMFHRINVEGTKNLLELSSEYGIRKFVFTSTCGLLGKSNDEPLSETSPVYSNFGQDYDLSKQLAESLVQQYFQEKGLPAVIVSLPKVFGPGLKTHAISVNLAIKNFTEGKLTFIPAPASYLSNYSYIGDVVQGHVLAMLYGVAGEKYILGGENISYADFFARLRKISSSEARVIPVSKHVVSAVATMQWLRYKISGKEPLFGANGVQHIYCNKAFSSAKAIRELGYSITSLEKGLQQTFDFLKSHSRN